ncbi:aminotransferase class IV [Candidatus Sumerlaeota bacterium]|nr:aminotransferase class IV [Candidatus Sumerlaeota bacterium]
MTILYLNGKFVEQQDAALDPLDRGVLLGDGIFETIRCEEGQLLFHSAHFARLGRNARIMEIPWNVHSEELLQICQQCLDANQLDSARIRITLTRGELGSSPEINASATAPTLIISAHAINQRMIDESRERGWTARIVQFPLNHRSPLSEVKSTSYQERLLARMVAKRDGYDEGVMLNTDGLLAEGAMTNIFIARSGKILTPPVEDGALPGIMRLRLGMISARLGFLYSEESLTAYDLLTADEAFFTNAIIEVMPLVRLDDNVIADGKPGLVSRRLQEENRRDVAAFLAPLRRG